MFCYLQYSPLSAHVWLWSWGPKMRFVTAPHQCLWPPSGLFSSADPQYLMLPSIHCLFQAAFKTLNWTQLAKGHLAGLRSLNHSACYAPEGAPSTPCLFKGWSGCMDLLSLVECYAFLPGGLSVTVSWSTTCRWILSQAFLQLQLTPLPVTWQGTCQLALGAWGRLFQIQPSSLLVFYPQMTGEHGHAGLFAKPRCLKKRTS